MCVGFTIPVILKVKIKESEKRDKNLDLTKKLKKEKAMEDVRNGDTNYNWRTWNCPQRFRKVGNRKKNRDYPNRSIAEIKQKTKKSPEDLKRLAVTQWKSSDNACVPPPPKKKKNS